MRVIVTGSRDWEGQRARTKVVNTLIAVELLARTLSQELIVVHGDCPTGADHIADQWARRRGVDVFAYPADWKMGKQAGFWRNQHMANLGADLCFAFLKDASPSTTDMVARAEERGIKTFTVDWDPSWPEPKGP